MTEPGKAQGGQQVESSKSGVPYAKWPESILDAKALKENMHQVMGRIAATQPSTPEDNEEVGFRERCEAKHRTTDRHMVCSKAEMLIDNWLYMADIVHTYERKHPIEGDVYSDFYIPAGNVYLEYWGYENEPKYRARKKKKLELYEKYGLNLIQLHDEEAKNLGNVLPRLVLKMWGSGLLELTFGKMISLPRLSPAIT